MISIKQIYKTHFIFYFYFKLAELIDVMFPKIFQLPVIYFKLNFSLRNNFLQIFKLLKKSTVPVKQFSNFVFSKTFGDLYCIE